MAIVTQEDRNHVDELELQIGRRAICEQFAAELRETKEALESMENRLILRRAERDEVREQRDALRVENEKLKREIIRKLFDALVWAQPYVGGPMTSGRIADALAEAGPFLEV